MQSASDMAYSRRISCAKFFQQIYREEGLHGLYRVSLRDIVYRARKHSSFFVANFETDLTADKKTT